MVQRAVGIVRHQGLFAIYNGISASLLRQLLLNTRFTIYEEWLDEIPRRRQGVFQRLTALSVDGQSEGVADRQRRRRQRCLSDARGPVGLRRLRRRLRLQSVRGGERADAERRQAVTWAEEKVRTEESG